MASQRPHHLRLDLRSAQFLTSFCSAAVESISLQGGAGGGGRKAGGGQSPAVSSKGRWLKTEVLGSCSVGWVIVKIIVPGSISF